MKKFGSLLLTLTFLFVTILGGCKVNAKVIDTSSKKTFQYIITPTSPDWKKFNVLELKAKLNIPMEKAESMDTDSLLDIVLNYPFLGDIYAFDNPVNALDFLGEQFNGIKVLLKRYDLKDKLVNKYQKSSNEVMLLKDNEKINNEKRYKQKYMESLLAYPTVANKLSNSEKSAIISNSKKVSSKIDTYPINMEYPQIFGSTVTSRSAGSIIRYGTVYTPKFSSVSVSTREDMTTSDMYSANAYMDSRYPNATRLAGATYKYNCHSYAWYSASTSNTWWMNDPSKYMSDGSYTKTYTPVPYNEIYYPMSGNTHSGIITGVSGSNVTVTSKWGAYGLYRHLSTDCPYYSMYLNTYWRLK